METTLKSLLFRLNLNDLLKGSIVAALAIIGDFLYKSLESGFLPYTWDQWQPILLFSLKAAGIYLLKNILTNSDGNVLKAENNK